MPNALMNITHAGINEKLQPTSHFTKIESLEADALNNRANNLKIKPKLDHKRSLSEERTISTSEQMHQKNPSVKNHNQNSCYNSSTTSGCTSSSISSLQDENLVTTRQSTDAIQHSFHSSAIKTLEKPYKIDSVDKAITTKSKSRLLSRIFSRKSSQKLSITTHKSSKTCLIM
jgi:diphthamide synthase subunit DPH2